MKSHCRILITSVLILILAACNSSQVENQVTPVQPATELPSATVQATSSPTATLAPTATFTPTKKPTATPTITPTPGPVVFADAFDKMTSDWTECEWCAWGEGGMYFGPVPASHAKYVHLALCDTCGKPVAYKMAVDVQWVDGQSDRGYGLLLKGTDDYAIVMEISPWQTLFLGRFDFATREWKFLNPNIENFFNGRIRPGNKTNHIEVETVLKEGSSATEIYISINGKVTTVLYNQPADPGDVGLEVGYHAVKVLFDNFEFTEYEEES